MKISELLEGHIQKKFFMPEEQKSNLPGAPSLNDEPVDDVEDDQEDDVEGEEVVNGSVK